MENYELIKKYSEVRNREVKLKRDLEHLNEINKEHEFVESLLKEFIILDIKYNNENLKQYVCMRKNESKRTISITLQNMYNSRQSPPRVYAEIQHGLENDATKVCKIIDIFAVEENVGNGSILLDTLFKYLKRQEVQEVRGWLSPVDLEEFDKLEKFYSKNGFTVSFDESRTSGSIKLILN